MCSNEQELWEAMGKHGMTCWSANLSNIWMENKALPYTNRIQIYYNVDYYSDIDF